MKNTLFGSTVEASRPRRLLTALAALGLVGLGPAVLAAGCNSRGTDPDDSTEQVGETHQALTQCVTIRRGAGTVADATLSKSPKNQNHGAEASLKVEKSQKNEALLRFDLSAIPSSAVVNSATLKLYVPGDGGCDHDDDDDDNGDHHSQQWHHNQGDHDAATIAIHRATQTWSEGTVTFNNFGQHFDAAVAGLLQTSSPSAQKSADVKSLVAAWVSGAKANQGFLLDTKSSRKTVFVSSENAVAALRPALEVCYTTPDDHCAPNPCQNGGACQNGPDSYTCACAPGFSGVDCETNINECAGNPCQNGGACADGVNGYTCTCAAGYDGAQCQTNIDECAPNPCQNSGVCTDGVNGYACACAPGYGGASCETDINECAGSPCQNGGACTDGVNTYTCTCAAGYSGAHCETNIDDCAGVTCQNGGTCIDGVASYACACAPGFTGASCETNINECASDPCLNGGTCVDGILGYACTCAAGYVGTNCEVDIDDCASAPCQNGGTCADGVNSYTCSCPAGFTGATCETAANLCATPCPLPPWADDECTVVPCDPGTGVCGEPDYYAHLHALCNGNTGACSGGVCHDLPPDCDSVACANGGQCVDSFCACPAGFAGTHCEIDLSGVDECAEGPCVNGGTCIDGLGSYTCSCSGGFTGEWCEIPPATATCPCSGDPTWEEGLAGVPTQFYQDATYATGSYVVGDVYRSVDVYRLANDGVCSASRADAGTLVSSVQHSSLTPAEVDACFSIVSAWISSVQ